MSYDMIFVARVVAADDDLAWDALEITRVIDGPLNPRIAAFIERVAALHETVDVRPYDDVLADGGTESWLLCGYGCDYAFVSLMRSEDERNAPVIIALAHEAGLTAFDARTRQVHRGEGYAGVVLEVENRAFLVAPPWDRIAAAIRDLTPDGGPSFLILERVTGDYAQIAGGDGIFVFEWREHHRDGFTHWVAGYLGEPNTGRVSVLTNGFHVPVRRNENMSLVDVERLFLAFLSGTGRPNSYHWRDMTAEFS